MMQTEVDDGGQDLKLKRQNFKRRRNLVLIRSSTGNAGLFDLHLADGPVGPRVPPVAGPLAVLLIPAAQLVAACQPAVRLYRAPE